ncbi:Uncharacterised protein [Pseudomonas aeruginosa]|uniref:Uncharacterized protein n=1 Tax=Pseudomonas paraeruginosa TaxID=2994495 RepID=A0A2R3IW39_9PSED|nr:hypothetical protein CSB93_4586 [Pseudomonas paraeruginosa]AWE92218.1 hypothetical protein CSC28_3374 [Pseudomonas paraeruginosa]PTC36348.1 hypothetical protein CLJ1_3207 [Pseudomonas aeruginosa]VFT57491.1 Uncharacterised protein [Pseudomonas aeruginosa]VTM13094.1 Uncharacterised protein [Pseudomonas aeruginosa]
MIGVSLENGVEREGQEGGRRRPAGQRPEKASQAMIAA